MGINGIEGISVSPLPLPQSSSNVTNQSVNGTVQANPAQVVTQPNKSAGTTSSNSDSQPENREALKEAVEKAQEFVGVKASGIQFTLDDESGKMIVKVIDRSTDEVIRQIPSKEMLEIAQALERLQGLLVKQKA